MSRAGTPVSMAEYEALCAAYYRLQTVTGAAKEAGLHYNTAKKYIERGDMDRGMPPIRQRWLQLQAEAQDRVDTAQIRAHEKVAKLAEGVLDAVAPVILYHGKRAKAELQRWQASGQADPDPADVPALRDAVQAVDKMGRLLRLLNGEADQRVEHTGDALQGMTEAEALEYVTTGQLPARLRARPEQVQA